MRLRIAIFIALGLTASVSASSAVAIIPRFNFLIAGRIELKRSNWSGFRSIGAPNRLNPDDEVRLQQGNSATILCSDLSRKDVPASGTYQLGRICPQAGLRILPGGSGGDYLPTRGGDDPLIPFVISPRKTQVLSDTPLIQWNSVPNATEYTVRVLSPDGVIWEDSISETQIRYPGIPALERGIRYAIEVRANTGTASTDEGIPGLAFSLVDEGIVQETTSEIASIAEQSLSVETEAYILAQVYRNKDLFTEAIATIEALNQESIQSSASYRLLGDIYLQVRLNLHAKDAYLKALEVAEDNLNIEEQAESLFALGNIYMVLNNIQEAIKCLEEAQNLYFVLEGNDSKTGQEIADQLAELDS
ncbi:MAG: tetratricopeptide repeat protein [Elainellaceae cyanobacterium]